MNSSNKLLCSPLPTVLVVLNQVISMQVLNWFPGIFTVWVASPFDQILKSLLSTKILVCQDCFDLPFFFSVYKISRRLGIIWPVNNRCRCLF